jgi:glycosyltransferase involved in cell wall biosynthesis
MRIALITASNPLATTATDGQLVEPALLARALAAHGHRVTVYARQQNATSPRAILGRGASVEPVAAGPVKPLPDDEAARHTPAFAGYLAGRWRARPPDVVHAFSWVGGLVALGAVRGTDIPVLQTFGSLAAAERRHEAGREISVARLRMEACIGRSADLVLAGSSDEAEELARLGVQKSAVRVIPSAVDTDVFTPDGDAAARNSQYRLAAVAPAGQPDGLPGVVRALAQLPETELLIIGGPAARNRPRTGPWRGLCELAEALGVRRRITFAGEVVEASLPPLLRSADLMVSAHRYEPAGIAGIRAMACGTPVVARAGGALGDAVVDGVTGLLIETDNAGVLARRIRALLTRPVQLQALGIAAADRARSRYAADRIGREIASAYDWCARGKSAAQADYEAEDTPDTAVPEMVALG